MKKKKNFYIYIFIALIIIIIIFYLLAYFSVSKKINNHNEFIRPDKELYFEISSSIESYFKKVNPLDKAGSFDIQGPGSFFIRRITLTTYLIYQHRGY